MAIKSAFTKLGNSASVGKNSRAKVVFPAPFGPAMMTMHLLLVDDVMVTQKTWSDPIVLLNQLGKLGFGIMDIDGKHGGLVVN